MATKKRISKEIIIALITAVTAIVVSLIGAPYVVNLFAGGTESKISVRVADGNAAPVSGARVVLFYDGGTLSERSDSGGIAVFETTASRGSAAHLFVETDQFEIYDETVALKGDLSIDVRLTPRGAANRTVIVRVVDDSNGVPIDGAEVLLVVGGDIFNESADSNGLAKFTIGFSGDTIDADISVKTITYNIEHSIVTLRPDEIQDVRLDPNANVIKVAAFQPPIATQPAGPSNLWYGQIVTGSISAPTEIDRYTFTGNADEVVLIKIAKLSDTFEARARLYDPSGVVIDTAATFANVSISAEINSILPASGEYVILVDDGQDGTQTGEYSLNLQKIR